MESNDSTALVNTKAEGAIRAGEYQRAIEIVCQGYASASNPERIGLSALLWKCLDVLLDPPSPDRVRGVLPALRRCLPREVLCGVLVTIGARIGNRLKDYEEDLKLQEEALHIAAVAGTREDTLRALSAVVFCLLELRRYDDADTACQRGLGLAEEAESPTYLEKFIEARAKVLLGLGKNAEAQRFLYGARRDALANGFLVVGARLGVALAEVHSDAGDPEEAGRIADEAFAEARQYGPRLEAELATRISAIWTRLEDWPRLDAILGRALELDDLLSVQESASNRHNLATAKSRLGDTQAAVRLEEEALARYESIGHMMGMDLARLHLAAYRRHAGQASLRDLVQCSPLQAAAALDELSPAREAAVDTAWLEHLQRQNLLGSAPPKPVAAGIDLQGGANLRENAVESLLRYCAQFGWKYRDLIAMEAGIAVDAPDAGALRRAAVQLEERLQNAHPLSGDQDLRLRWILALVYERQGETASANRVLTAAIERANASEAALPEVAARRTRTRLAMSLGHLDDAMEEHGRISRLLATARRDASWTAEGRRLFLDDNFGFVEEMVEAAHKACAVETAIVLLEYYRSQSFLESLQAQQPLPLEARDHLDGLQQELQEAQDRLIGARLVRSGDRERLRLQIANLRRQREHVLAMAGGEAVRAAAAMEPFGHADLDSLLRQRRAVVVYFVGERATYAFGMANGSTLAVKRDISRRELQSLVEECRQWWNGDAGLGRVVPSSQLMGAARQGGDDPIGRLAGIVIRGIWSGIPSAVPIIVVAQDVLCLVPFDALPEPDTDRLLADERTMSFVPNLTALVRRRPEVADTHDVCIAGVAKFPAPVGDAPRFADLPGVWPELETIGRFFGARPLVDHECNAAALREHLPSARMVHIATHGYADPDDPLLSSLVLGNGEFLKAGEVATLALAAECVTLSACETGVGAMSRGEGVLGLAQGFLFAGARAVVASLWRVDDRSTALLFCRFYQALANGEARADALRAAKSYVRHYTDGDHGESPFADPFYWAPFVLWGQPGAISIVEEES